MVLDPLDPYRFERPVADVQGDRDPFDAAGGKVVEHLLGEVQAGGRRRDRAARRREDRLVTIAVGQIIGAPDVGGQRHVAERFDQLVDAAARPIRLQPDPAPAEEALLEHFAGQRAGRSGESHDCPGLELLAGMHQRVALDRLARSGGRQRQQQTLDRAATRYALAGQSRGEHARVVDDQQITRAEVFPQLRHAGMIDTP
jgi:hypothetical protein